LNGLAPDRAAEVIALLLIAYKALEIVYPLKDATRSQGGAGSDIGVGALEKDAAGRRTARHDWVKHGRFRSRSPHRW
jgi:hypothetical protein